MKRLDWAALRLLAKPYAKRGALGALVGAIIGFGGAKRDLGENGLPPGNAEALRSAVSASVLGLMAGLIFWRLRHLREGGSDVHYCLSWALSVLIATGLFFLPETVRTGDWLSLAIVTLTGGIAGLGLGAYVRLIVGKN